MATLFRRLLGPHYTRLSPVVQRLHARTGTQRLSGEVRIERGPHPLARLMGAVTSLPPQGDGPIDVIIEAEGARETWTRRVGGRAMRSVLDEADGLLRERLGPVTFRFELQLEPRDGTYDLRWRVAGVRALGVPLPPAWFEGVNALEYERDGRYGFDVRAHLPGVGLLVHYTGWLDVD